jgi:predicted metal-binding membrane protein
LDPARRSPVARFGADRLIIVASLIALTAGAWAWLWLHTSPGASEMSAAGGEAMPMLMPMDSMPGMASMASMAPTAWNATTFALAFTMWWIMMLGMMIPSALPAILLHARVQRRYHPAAAALRRTALFTGGYLAAWGVFSVLATALQWSFDSSGMLSPITLQVSSTLGAGLFAVAGIYQLSPLKNVCLQHCRSPAEFLAMHRRPGAAGAFVTGAHHGIYCVGCCWPLMLLLFAGGIMNLVWVAALAALVLLEKLMPRGHWLARGAGVAMLAIAAAMLVQTNLAA